MQSTQFAGFGAQPVDKDVEKKALIMRGALSAIPWLIWVCFFAKAINYEGDDKNMCVFKPGSAGKLEAADYKLEGGDQDMFKIFDDRAMFGLIISSILLGTAVLLMAAALIESTMMISTVTVMNGLAGLGAFVFWIMTMVTSFNPAG